MPEKNVNDFLIYYGLEEYLFEKVRPRFHRQHYIDAFDFFSIVIWKANRAKSKIAKRLLKKKNGGKSLNESVRKISAAIYKTPNSEEKLKILIDEGFLLPMVSAILTVLYPDDFTIYDWRVCESLNGFSSLSAGKKNLWRDYSSFVEAVKKNTPKRLSLREKDRYLWAKSAMKQLQNDIVKWQKTL
jgi:hypothetical protein